MRKKVWLVQSSVTPEPWMPLSCGYLKAAALADPALSSELDIRIFSFGSEASAMRMCDALYGDEVPDVIGFSVLGWNYLRFQRVSEVFRMRNPRGWIIYGGNHTANQAEQVFAECPHVDVVVNGEGELAFPDLLRAHVSGRSVHELHHIAGISFKGDAGPLIQIGAKQGGASQIVTTPLARIPDLDQIPSPLLTGAIDLLDPYGMPLYPGGVLMETNRGCPFRCSFCFWGGAIGQKVRAFSSERLREELEYIARSRTSAITLCDANFGMIPKDEQFVEDLLKTKERFGYPQMLFTAWGKNKSDLFYRVVQELRRGELFSSFIISLQSTNGEALKTMRRSNMKINDWTSLADWCAAQGLAVSSELIWGCPGETEESFLAGFDEVAAKVDRISCYDLKLMPNTEYWDKREELGIVAKRGEQDDFYTVLSHNTMSLETNRRMFRFLFWQKLLHDFFTFRYLWRPLAKLGGVTCSQALLSIDRWLDACPRSNGVGELLEVRDQMIGDLDVSRVPEAVRVFFRNWSELKPCFDEWFESAVLPEVPTLTRDLLADVFRFDQISMPIYDLVPSAIDSAAISDVMYYAVRDVPFDYDVPSLAVQLHEEKPASLRPQPIVRSFLFQRGFARAIAKNTPYALGNAYAGQPIDPQHLRALVSARISA